MFKISDEDDRSRERSQAIADRLGHDWTVLGSDNAGVPTIITKAFSEYISDAEARMVEDVILEFAEVTV